MSKALYNNLEGLRFWTESELKLREQIKNSIVECVDSTLRQINQMWRLYQVEAPLMMPMDKMSSSYTRDDVFVLMDPPGGEAQFGLRPETTNGSYEIAQSLILGGEIKAPCGIYQIGPSFRRETSDGATAAKLRFNQFNQLEFQLIMSQDTKADLATPLRNNLVSVIKRATGKETRLIESDRLPSYSTETIDIEVFTGSEWREVASTSRRTDAPVIAGHRPLMNLELAFGIDRLVVLSS